MSIIALIFFLPCFGSLESSLEFYDPKTASKLRIYVENIYIAEVRKK